MAAAMAILAAFYLGGEEVHGDIRMKYGFMFRLGSFWWGAHWSPYNKRLCVNLVPCCTIWVVWPGGKIPHERSGGKAPR